ncbi:PD40 domain-containing protein [Candidatus Poribacteria bacterium]|nr:PD40 domain-containing protein [Candidatus Poribacteria bacterium]
MKFSTIDTLPVLIKRNLACKMLGIVLMFGYSPFFINTSTQAAEFGTIAFASTRIGNTDIYILNKNDENLRRLTNDPARESEPTWSPDDRFLAYTYSLDGNSDIYVINTRTKERRQLTHNLVDDYFPAWSPNGKWIAFVSGIHEQNADIYRMDIDGTNLRRLTDRGKNGRPTWSPDSQWIAFVSYDRGERKGIYIMDVNGKRLRRLDDKAVQMINGVFHGECAWSPDGKQIAFGLHIRDEKRMHLCTIDIDGKNFRQLTQGGPILKPMKILGFPNPAIYYPAWSPDSKWIAYVFSDDPQPFQFADIYVIEAIGNGREKSILIGEIDMSSNSYPTWAPEGFFDVSLRNNQKAILWSRLKQGAD